jgi:hypothetical protein
MRMLFGPLDPVAKASPALTPHITANATDYSADGPDAA